MRALFLALLTTTAACAEQNADTAVQAPSRQVELSPPKVDVAVESKTIASVLDDWHAAAARADEKRYFDHFADQAVFLGTDATERWDLEGFRKAVHPYFEQGKAWKYRSVRRAINVSPDGKRAWFDEDLETEKLGPARGSGVLVKENGRWKIAQYDLSIPIPNARFKEVRAILSAAPRIELREQYKNVYKAATTSAKDDPAAAAKLLSDLLPEAKTRPDDDLEFWIHNEITWLRWAQGDLDGAIAEVDAAKATLDHSTIPEEKRVGLRLHELWDRAYLLLDAAMTKKLQVAERARALQAAARREQGQGRRYGREEDLRLEGLPDEADHLAAGREGKLEVPVAALLWPLIGRVGALHWV